ncbi:ABC-three component system middle component 1 [Lachnotalea glycerini]|uniref:ABC-three component system middle component 1 n=1 Tax=Lachnotalea glycerini TaxID=1763509 RepID=UPI0011B70B0B|nr:ABC-three component system middle component 1 [Lachnotalea glycerini]
MLRNIFVNNYDEMYFVIETELDKNTLDEVISICAEVEKDSQVKKSYKSNWGVILITAIEGELTWQQRKRVMSIEENKFFCRKYVLWYNDEEKKKLEEICGKDYGSSNMSTILENYDLFKEFKINNNVGYDLLSRIFIKLPYLNLNSLETTDKTILDFIKIKLNNIHPELYRLLVEDNNSEIEDYVLLSDNENESINKKIEELLEGKK